MLIERLFSRFSSLYGASFGRQWDGTDLVDVKNTWADKLGGFTAEQIGAGLNACDDRQYPPNLPEFLGMCRTRAQQNVKRLDPPPVSREEAERIMKKAADRLPAKGGGSDLRGWATRLRERYIAGEPLMLFQISAASEALGEVWSGRACTVEVIV